MRIRIRRQTAERGGQTVDATPPRVEVASGEYRAAFDAGEVYDVTALEWLVLRDAGHFEQVAPVTVRRYTLGAETKVGTTTHRAGARVELTDDEARAAGLVVESGEVVSVEQFPTDAEIEAERRRLVPGAMPNELATTTAPPPGTSTQQQHELTSTPDPAAVAAASSPTRGDAAQQHEGAPQGAERSTDLDAEGVRGGAGQSSTEGGEGK